MLYYRLQKIVSLAKNMYPLMIAVSCACGELLRDSLDSPRDREKLYNVKVGSKMVSWRSSDAEEPSSPGGVQNGLLEASGRLLGAS